MNNIGLDFKIMKDDEFAVLCALCGINKFFGTLNISTDNLDKQQLYNILYKLINKKIVVYKGDELALSRDISPIIQELRRVKKIISFVNTRSNINQCFYYNSLSDNCINIEKRWEDSSSIWIRKVKKEDILDICYDMQLLPNMAELKHLKEERKDILKEILELAHLTISLYDITTENKYREIVFQNKGLELKLILKQNKEEIYTDIYSQEIIAELITRLIGE